MTKIKCEQHELGMKMLGRDDQTVQLRCLKCGHYLTHENHIRAKP